MDGKTSFIVHIDMDAFFASVEQRDNPEYRNKPVIVGSDPKGGKGRGVVATCSYEARRYGIHSAMPISMAYRKCPHAVFLPVDMEKYKKVSNEAYNIFYDFTPHVEPVSIDEAFLDITTTHHLFGGPKKTCVLLKERIKSEIGLTASVGLSPVMMVSKIASDLRKPDGLVEVKAEEVLDFLRPLDIRRLWGMGEKSENLFKSMGIKTIGDLARQDAGYMTKIFGKNGKHLWELANGIDLRKVSGSTEKKSISNEVTFEMDTDNMEEVRKTLMCLSESVSSRLRDEGIKGRTITLKIRLEGFHTFTRANTILTPTNYTDVIYKEAGSMLDAFNRKNRKIRLVGVKVSGLSQCLRKDCLFSENEGIKKEKIYNAIDLVRKKYGDESIHRARSV